MVFWRRLVIINTDELGEGEHEVRRDQFQTVLLDRVTQPFKLRDLLLVEDVIGMVKGLFGFADEDDVFSCAERGVVDVIL